MSLLDFEIIQKLGQGSYGQVFKVKRAADNSYYALKKVRLQKLKNKDKNNAINQIRLLASVRNDNIICFKQAFYDQTQKTINMVMQLAMQGDLQAQIKQKIKQRGTFEEWFIWKTGYQILTGLQALHNQNILHRDLKPANIFFNNNIAKIGDMNISTFIDSSMAKTQVGTPFYASPQIWNNNPYKFECDIWSFGCVMYEMCNLKAPFRANNSENLGKMIKRGQFEAIRQPYSKKLVNIIAKCLKVRNRANMQQVISVFQQNVDLKVIKSERVLKQSNSLKLYPKRRLSLQKLLPLPRYSEKNGIVLRKVQSAKKIDFLQKVFDIKKQDQNLQDKMLSDKTIMRKIRSQKLLPPIKKLEPFCHQLRRTPQFKEIKGPFHEFQKGQFQSLNHIFFKNKRFIGGIHN